MREIIIVLLSIVLLSSCISKEGIHTDETLDKCKANVISKDSIRELLVNKEIDGIQFVDIRNPHEFAMGHLPNAISIPQENFFDKERFDQIDKEAKIILYGDDASMPKMIALMANHFEKGDFYIALGGYDYLNEENRESFGLGENSYDDEIPVVDYQKEIDEIVSKSGVAPKPASKKKVSTAKPMIVRKKKAVSGGCG